MAARVASFLPATRTGQQYGQFPTLALGGPSVMVSADSGYAVETGGRSAAQVVQGLSEALVELTEPATWQRLSDGARRRVHAFTYDALVDRVYTPPAAALVGRA